MLCEKRKRKKKEKKNPKSVSPPLPLILCEMMEEDLPFTFFARLMATRVPSASVPLYTVPNPPCPILQAGEKFLVAL